MTAHGVPSAPWDTVAWHVRQHWQPFQRNTHHVLAGSSGSGKSHLARRLLTDALGPYAIGVIVDLKPGGDRVWRDVGHHVGPRELPCPLRPFKAERGSPGIFHVSAPNGLSPAEARRVLEQLAAERGAIAVLDDATTITDSPGERGGMGLGGLVDVMLREGRTNALSMVLGINAPKWAGRGGAKVLAGTYWLGWAAGKETRDGFAELAGLPPGARPALDPEYLPEHTWLYSAADRTAPGNRALALTEPAAA